MYEVVALALAALLATSGYAAGRLHGQHSYRLGYRLGYRQGYFDGDRSSWTRRRRELQSVVTTVLTAPVPERAAAFAGEVAGGTVYGSQAGAEAGGLGAEADGLGAGAYGSGASAAGAATTVDKSGGTTTPRDELVEAG